MKHVIQGFCINSKGVDADAVAARLLELSKQNEGLTAELVLAEAADVSSPLHDVFEWDDTEAATQWRLHQARNLIRSIRVIPSEVQVSAPRVIFVKTETVYLPTSQVVKSETLYQQAMNLLVQRIDQAERAAEELRNAADSQVKKETATKAINALKSAKESLAMSA